MLARRRIPLALLVAALAATALCRPESSPPPALPHATACGDVVNDTLSPPPPLAVDRTAATPEAVPTASDAAAAAAAALAAIQRPGSKAEKLALLRAAAQMDARRVALFAAAVRTPHCREPVRIGDTPAEFALQQLLRASRTDATARAALAELAFDEWRVPAFHRERAARAYAATASLREAELLRAQAGAMTDPVLRDALLAGLGDVSNR